MSPDPTILQAAVSIPVTVGLVVYTLIRWDRRPLHLLLAALLTAVALWLGGLVLKLGEGPEWIRLIGLDLEMGAAIFLPPLILITMGYFARSALFEQSHAPAAALMTVSGLFLLVFLTDDQHHLFFTDRTAAIAGAHPDLYAGPVFWAQQIWSAICDAAALAYCLSVLFKGRTAAERGRAGMIFGAVLLPIAAHILHLLGWTPFEYSLAPATVAVTAAFFVQGVHRYGLLGGQTIVRHDLIEHMAFGLLLADEQGTVLDANRAAEELIGTDRESMRNSSLLEVIMLLEPDEASRDFGERLMQMPLDGSRIDAEIRTGDDRILEASGGGVPTLGSQPSGRFVTLEDRTAQRHSERMLRERQKLESVGIMAAGVAHEVNNPLAYVRSNLVHLRSIAETLPKQLADGQGAELDDALGDEMPEVIDESIEGLDRIARIVESMLRFSRTSDEEYRPVDLSEVVDEALRLAALQRETRVRVERIGGPVPRVLGNAERLVQVLLNLFLNARQALSDRDDGAIEAETTIEGDHVLVRIRDNGPGIPPELEQRIFDPFFTTRAPDAGTGLGLSIAFDIVREHGGTLEVSSKVGAGTCFTVRLAAAPGEEIPSSEAWGAAR